MRLQVHRSRRVLHGAVIHHDQLLYVLRNRGARILAKLRRHSGQSGSQAERGRNAHCRDLHRKSSLLLPFQDHRDPPNPYFSAFGSLADRPIQRIPQPAFQNLLLGLEPN